MNGFISASFRIGFVVVCLLTAVNGYAQTGLTSEQIDRIVLRSMEKYQVPGMAIGVVKDGKVVHLKGYGVADINTSSAVDEDTLFAIASNSKAFLTTAIALLVDDGKLRWDDPVTEYLPEFQLHDPWVTREFTIRDLVTHRSGLGSGAGDLMFVPETRFSREEIIYNLRYLKPVSSFRSEYAYDNLLYIVAGEIIPKVAGVSFEDFVETRIIEPLDMTRCAANTAGLVSSDGNVARPHVILDGALSHSYPINDPDEPNVTAAAGGLQCSASSMLKWMQMHLDGGRLQDGEQLLSKELHLELLSPQTLVPTRDWNREVLKTNFTTYGLGFGIQDIFGYKYVRHGGGLPGMLTHVDMIPALNLGIVTLTNQQAPSSREVIYLSILSSYLGIDSVDWFDEMAMLDAEREAEAAEALEKAEAVALEQRESLTEGLPLETYTGVYEDPWFGRVTISKESDGLYFRSERQPLLSGPLTRFSGDTFASEWVYRAMEANAYVLFERGFMGEITGMRMKAISPLTDFSFDFHDLEFVKPGTEE